MFQVPPGSRGLDRFDAGEQQLQTHDGQLQA